MPRVELESDEMADLAVGRILSNLCDRRNLKWDWQNCAATTQKNLREDWIQIVKTCHENGDAENELWWERAAEKIIADLRKSAVFRKTWAGIDRDVREEIEESWSDLIWAVYADDEQEEEEEEEDDEDEDDCSLLVLELPLQRDHAGVLVNGQKLGIPEGAEALRVDVAKGSLYVKTFVDYEEARASETVRLYGVFAGDPLKGEGSDDLTDIPTENAPPGYFVFWRFVEDD